MVHEGSLLCGGGRFSTERAHSAPFHSTMLRRSQQRPTRRHATRPSSRNPSKAIQVRSSLLALKDNGTLVYSPHLRDDHKTLRSHGNHDHKLDRLWICKLKEALHDEIWWGICASQ